jgi:hypothetical protein
MPKINNLKQERNMKEAIVFFILGIGQGFILTDWLRDKQALKINKPKKSIR